MAKLMNISGQIQRMDSMMVASKLPYDVVRADELKDYILGNKDVVYENDRMFVVKKIDDVRVN